MLRGRIYITTPAPVCAPICMRCAADCEKLAGKDSQMKNCAELCTKCADSCTL